MCFLFIFDLEKVEVFKDTRLLAPRLECPSNLQSLHPSNLNFTPPKKENYGTIKRI